MWMLKGDQRSPYLGIVQGSHAIYFRNMMDKLYSLLPVCCFALSAGLFFVRLLLEEKHSKDSRL